MVGKKVIVLANLKEAKLVGFKSQGIDPNIRQQYTNCALILTKQSNI
jgi:hypothetical protein